MIVGSRACTISYSIAPQSDNHCDSEHRFVVPNSAQVLDLFFRRKYTTSGHHSRSNSGGAPMRVQGFEKSCSSRYMRARHRCPRQNVKFYSPVIVIELRRRGCFAPSCQYIQPRCRNVGLRHYQQVSKYQNFKKFQ